MNKDKKVLLALLAGAAAGVIAAVLLATEDGKSTRNKLTGLAGDLLTSSKEKIKNIKGKAVASGDDSAETTLGI